MCPIYHAISLIIPLSFESHTCAVLLKSPNCASQQTKLFGLVMLKPSSKPARRERERDRERERERDRERERERVCVSERERERERERLIPKTIGNRKRDCALGCARGINTT